MLLHGPGEFKERWVRVHPRAVPHPPRHRSRLPWPRPSGTHPDGLDADRVFAWLDDADRHLLPRPPVLVGHILGGSVAARYAAGRPAASSGLVLVDSLGLAKFRPNPRFALGLIGFMARPSERSHRRFMGQCLADADPVAQAMGDKWVALREYTLDRAKDPDVKAAMKFFMGTLGVPPHPRRGPRSDHHADRAVWGREDKANRLRIARRRANVRVAAARHRGAADDPPMERPDEFVAAVLSSESAPWQRVVVEDAGRRCGRRRRCDHG